MENMKNLTVRQILDIIKYLQDARDNVNKELANSSTEDYNPDKEHNLIEERNKLNSLIATLYNIKT